jgi:hypothetical protein
LRRLCATITLLSPALASTAAAQGEASAFRLATPSFVFVRYATESASALYAARGFGPLGGFVAMVQNPKTGYRELIVGGLTQAVWGRQSILMAVAYADVSESPYLQTYIAPTFSRGRLTLSGTVEWYEPLESAGTRQLDVNPASLMARVSGKLSIGAAYTVGLEARQRARSRAGPAMELKLPWGTLRMELLDRLSGGPTELRPSIFAAF